MLAANKKNNPSKVFADFDAFLSTRPWIVHFAPATTNL